MAERRHRSSRIVDANTNEYLPYVNVYVSDAQGIITRDNIGTTTNEEGKFLIRAAPDDYITVSFVGMDKQTFRASELPNVIRMGEGGVGLKEFTVVGRQSNKGNWMMAGFIGGGLLIASIITYAIVKSVKARQHG